MIGLFFQEYYCPCLPYNILITLLYTVLFTEINTLLYNKLQTLLCATLYTVLYIVDEAERVVFL